MTPELQEKRKEKKRKETSCCVAKLNIHKYCYSFQLPRKIKEINMIEKIMSFFKKPKEETIDLVPEGIYPNCWGEQEYDHQIRQLYKDQQIDVNNHAANYAFIQKFMVTHLDGIRLKKGNDGLECPTCQLKT
ncbi:MAG: hypothetical protein OEQ53_04315 [Saprospiraceae bacterium]|nr:hypothetical protein [Saprospiraceae bacterium]